MEETMIMGLRMTQQGVSAKKFHERFGVSIHNVYGNEVSKLLEYGLLEWADANNDILRLTQRAKLLGNQVFVMFLKNGSKTL